uniref:Uncharacterized protein n=1 Tax=Panagrolaimus superbus TaxID=310955 RepID=A0A914YRS8_9BILA
MCIGQLDHVYANFHSRGYHKDIFIAIRNLSIHAGQIDSKLLNVIESKPDFGQFKSILDKPFWPGFNPLQQIDERLRWSEKEHFNEKKHRIWFNSENNENKCLNELTINPCQISNECAINFFNQTGFNGYQLSNQIFYLLIAKGLKCEKEILQILNETRSKSINDHVIEFCTNIHFELKKFQRDKKKIARIDQKFLELLLEQVFVCGQFGFVEFVDTHFIVAALSWQHPKIGCYTNSRPEGVPNMGISGDIGVQHIGVSKQEDTCLPHFTAVAAVALVTALRFILDPSPWPEYHSAADQLVTIDRIVAEDQYHTFRYIQWVRDAHFPSNMRPPAPPSVAIAPDLIAFVALLFIFLVGSVIAHNACTSNNSRPFGKQKQLYPFAYKKL